MVDFLDAANQSNDVEHTSISLLQAFQDDSSESRWEQLHAIYRPLLMRWIRKYDVQAADAEDLCQDVLAVVANEIVGFRHSGQTGAFRAWLRQILVYRLQDFWRKKRRAKDVGFAVAEQSLQQLAEPTSEASRIWDKEHDEWVLKRLFERAQRDFTETTWAAFQRVTVMAQPPRQVAEDLGISVNAVFVAKSRVLSRLRQDAKGILDSAGDFSPS